MTPIDRANATAREVYAAIAQDGLACLQDGRVAVDPHLDDIAGDRREGLSVIIRPDAALQARLAEVAQVLATAAPGQHLYLPDEFHVTVLTLISPLDGLGACQGLLSDYVAAAGAAARRSRSFALRFAGVIASPQAVLVQGWDDSGGLAALREELRRTLREQGLAASLDRRYVIRTAHTTVLRFRTQLADPAPLRRAIESLADAAFGELPVAELHVNRNNWFMSRGRVRTLAVAPLGGAGMNGKDTP